MASNKDIKILPSPYPVVNEYENIFVQEGAAYIAGLVTEVLEYVNDLQKNDIQ